MSDAPDSTQIPENIWIITAEVTEKLPSKEIINRDGSRSGKDAGGRLGDETQEEIIITKKQGEVAIIRRKVEVTKLKQEMRGFLRAMREMLDEAEAPNSQMQLDEVELSVEINGEGQVSLFGLGGGKAGGKGAMVFKFKRRSHAS